jgi:hypothetical protein
MANVMESLFGLGLTDQKVPIVSDPLGAFTGLGAQTGASLQRNIAQAFGQQTQQQALSSIIQQTQQQADLGTPEGLIQLANNLNQLPQFSGMAVAIRQEANKLAKEQQLTQAKIFESQATGTAALARAAQEREPKEPTKVGVSEATGENVFIKGGQQFTIDAQGNRVPFAGKIREGGRDVINIVNPQEAQLISQGQTATKAITDRVGAINRSLTLNAQNSPFAGATFKQEVTSIFGDAQKAAAEISALGNTGALDTRIANRILNFFEGKTTQTTKEDRDAVLKVLRSQSKDEYERTLNPFRAAVDDKNKAMRIFPSFEERYGTPSGITKPGVAIPKGQESKYPEGSKWEKGGKKYIVRGGLLIEE